MSLWLLQAAIFPIVPITLYAVLWCTMIPLIIRLKVVILRAEYLLWASRVRCSLMILWIRKAFCYTHVVVSRASRQSHVRQDRLYLPAKVSLSPHCFEVTRPESQYITIKVIVSSINISTHAYMSTSHLVWRSGWRQLYNDLPWPGYQYSERISLGKSTYGHFFQVRLLRQIWTCKALPLFQKKSH